MQKQERRYPLSEVHTKTGLMGEIHLDQAFLRILGIEPGDFVCFLVDASGNVTVKGKKAELSKELKEKIEAGRATLEAMYPVHQESILPPVPAGANTPMLSGISVIGAPRPGEVSQAALFADAPPLTKRRNQPQRR